jgi:surface polysaccharide O-acyltransferase-like enzyme
MKPTENITYIHHLRAIATIAVILLHIVADSLYSYGTISLVDWHSANIIDSLIRFSVPTFIMISGVLLMGKQEFYFEYINKRVKRVFIPFTFWVLAYFSFDLLIAYKNQLFSAEFGIIEFIKFHFLSGSSFHFWYIYMILIIYALLPLVSKRIVNLNQQKLLVIIVIWLIYISFLGYTTMFQEYNLVYLTLKFIGYFGYILLGYYLFKFPLFNSKKTGKIVGIFLYLIASFVTIYLTYYYTNLSNRFQDDFYEYFTLNIAVQTIGVFLIFQNFEFKNTFLTKISSLSYGIYLVHVFAIILVLKLPIDQNIPVYVVSKLLLTILAFVISILVINFMHKIPFLKRFAG